MFEALTRSGMSSIIWYSVKLTHKAADTLREIDYASARLILEWIRKYLINTDNPRRDGKALHSAFKGSWRYRVNEYSLICELQDHVILILAIDSRRDTGD